MPAKRTTTTALLLGAAAATNGYDGAPWERFGGLLWDDATDAELAAYRQGYTAHLIDERNRRLSRLAVGDAVLVHESAIRGARSDVDGRVVKILSERRALVEIERNGKTMRRRVCYGALYPMAA